MRVTQSLLISLCMMVACGAQAADVPKAAPAAKAIAKKPVVANKKSNKAQLAELEALSIAKGADIEVYKYDAKADVFEIIISDEKGVGPNFATPEALHKAIGSEQSLQDFLRSKKDFVGSEHKLIQNLPLIDEDDVAKRADK